MSSRACWSSSTAPRRCAVRDVLGSTDTSEVRRSVLAERKGSWSMPAQKKYSDELRERATRLALESGRPVAHVAQDLGVHKEALRTWVRQAKADAAGGTPTVLSGGERERLKELALEVRELRNWRDMGVGT